MRALIYARVSSDAKGRGRSVSEQIDECTALAEREEWTIVDVLQDNDRSASRHAKQARPAWGKVKDIVAKGDVDVLVTWEASRAQRDLDAYADLRQLCATSGVKWCYGGNVYDLTERSDRFRTGLDALVAEDEADRTRERVLRAMRANAHRGRPHGRPLYGYRRIYDPHTGELLGQEIDHDKAAIIREAARRFLAGESTRSIANDLNARGVPSPANGAQGWQLSQVRRMLSRPAYNAKRVHRGEVVGYGDWPAILDDETYGQLSARFADPTRRTSRRSPTTRLLTGAVRCGVCGGPMVYAKMGTAKRGHWYQYTCKYKFCTARSMPALDAYVTAIVLARLERPDAREVIAGAKPDADVSAAMGEAAELRARLDDAVAQFTAGKLSAATLAAVEADLLPRMAEAEKRARVAGLPTSAAAVASSDDVAAAWDELTVEQRREIVRALLTVVVLPVKTKGRKAFDPDCVRIEWKR